MDTFISFEMNKVTIHPSLTVDDASAESTDRLIHNFSQLLKKIYTKLALLWLGRLQNQYAYTAYNHK